MNVPGHKTGIHNTVGAQFFRLKTDEKADARKENFLQ